MESLRVPQSYAGASPWGLASPLPATFQLSPGKENYYLGPEKKVCLSRCQEENQKGTFTLRAASVAETALWGERAQPGAAPRCAAPPMVKPAQGPLPYLPAAFVGYPLPLAVLVAEGCSLHAQPRLQRPRGVVNAAVNHAAVVSTLVMS